MTSSSPSSPEDFSRAHDEHLRGLDEAGVNRWKLANIITVLDKSGADSGVSWQDFQQQLEPNFIHFLFEETHRLWEQHPFNRIKPVGDAEVCGLYLGSMEPAAVRNGVAQALMYCDRVYVIDPFSVPLARMGEFNPLNVPEKYIFDSILSIQEVLAIAPFVIEDLVRFVPAPDLFDPKLFLKMQKLAEERVARQPSQPEDFSEFKSNIGPNFVRWMGTWSDDGIYNFRINTCGDTPEIARQKVKELRKLISDDPRRISLQPTENQVFRTHTSGLNTEMSIYAANYLNVFPFTNLKSSWRELTNYQGEIPSQSKGWFAIEQCLQKVKFPNFGSIDPKFLLTIRADKRFQALRNALRDLWKAVGRQELDDRVLKELTEKLEVEAAKIQTQLDGLNNDYRKWLIAAGASSAASVAAAGITGDVKLLAVLLASFAGAYAKAGERTTKIQTLARQSPLSIYFSKLR